MKTRYALSFFLCLGVLANAFSQNVNIPLSVIKDKIKGGWAGQTIGVTFGGPHEFRFNGTFIQDYQPLEWNDGMIRDALLNNPGLYDDVYMDLTFVETFEKYGLEAPVDSFASAYAHAGYMLWHANQAGRYNILNGIRPPASGHWLNNPHADDIDFQIESDFAGLMSPAMPQAAAYISDKIGHIMNYGDGWYGGVYISTMYSLAFTRTNIKSVVTEALKAIPVQSAFYQCINDVIRWHEKYPNDWKQTWFELQKKWSSETGCPDGVFAAFNIDAKINAAYVVMGLLYGNGDFSKTMDIATRTGQDADCNPSSAAGVLGCLIGYEKIPARWKKGLELAEDIVFKYTHLSIKQTYEISYQHALKNIQQQGGRISSEKAFIPLQPVKPVVLEQSFTGLIPVRQQSIWNNDAKEVVIEFEGEGIVVRGEAFAKNKKGTTLEISIQLDQEKPIVVAMPTDYITRRLDVYWNYQLRPGKHRLELKLMNPSEDHQWRTTDYLVYRRN